MTVTFVILIKRSSASYFVIYICNDVHWMCKRYWSEESVIKIESHAFNFATKEPNTTSINSQIHKSSYQVLMVSILGLL
jgi:hypothetical protein